MGLAHLDIDGTGHTVAEPSFCCADVRPVQASHSRYRQEEPEQHDLDLSTKTGAVPTAWSSVLSVCAFHECPWLRTINQVQQTLQRGRSATTRHLCRR